MKVGDLIRVKNTEQKMTVEAVAPDWVVAAWFEQVNLEKWKSDLHRKLFDIDEVELVE